MAKKKIQTCFSVNFTIIRVQICTAQTQKPSCYKLTTCRTFTAPRLLCNIFSYSDDMLTLTSCHLNYLCAVILWHSVCTNSPFCFRVRKRQARKQIFESSESWNSSWSRCHTQLTGISFSLFFLVSLEVIRSSQSSPFQVTLGSSRCLKMNSDHNLEANWCCKDTVYLFHLFDQD